MKRIFIGIPCYEPLEEFELSLSAFLHECADEYSLTVCRVYGKKLVDAQNDIATQFMASDCEYLLMLEDDHAGHTKQMLNDLVESGYDMCGNYYYSRHYPYVVIPVPLKDPSDPTEWSMTTIKPNTKFAEMGLCGFGMTLLKRRVFELLDKPYFNRNVYKDGSTQRGYATDQDFCIRLHKLGLTVGGSYATCLSHRGIDDTTVHEFRDKDVYKNMMHRRFAYHRKRESNAVAVK